jgi:cytochrome oxidase assembly protein ShyY1
MLPDSENSYDRNYGSRRLSGNQMDRKVKEENVEVEKLLNELGIPVNNVTSLLGGQIDVKRRTVVGMLTDESETSYYVQTPLGELSYEIEN